jgi:S1-C subfamily serine protease
MRTLTRSWVLALSVALAGIGAPVTRASTAEAQGLEYCRDLGVMVQHVPAGLSVVALRGGGVGRQLGLRRGDLIWAVDNAHPDTLDQVHEMIFLGADGAVHDLDVLRGAAHLHTGIFHMHGIVVTQGTLH